MKLLNYIKGRLNLRKNPYSEADNKFSCIYVHIPKTGGNGICQSLFGVGGSGHHRLEDYYKSNSSKFESFYKFTVVRNPYQRFISAFHYLKSGGIAESDVNVFKDALSDVENTDDFIERLKRDATLMFNVLNYIHFKPQSFFLEGSIHAKSIDHIGRQEDMISTYNLVKKQLNITEGEFIIANKTPSYDKALSEESKEFIYQLYQKDFTLLGYEK